MIKRGRVGDIVERVFDFGMTESIGGRVINRWPRGQRTGLILAVGYVGDNPWGPIYHYIVMPKGKGCKGVFTMWPRELRRAKKLP